MIRILPNLLTLSNALAGFAAIIVFFYTVWQGRPEFGITLAGWLVLFAVLFDGLDGYTARKLDAASSIGLQLDSLADFLTFGTVPPVILAYRCIVSEHPALAIFGIAAAGMYLCCAAWRLAVYNTQALQGGTDGTFHGLPVPGAAAAIMSSLVLVSQNADNPRFLWFVALYCSTAGLLMISKVSYVHMWKWVTSEHRGIRYLITAALFFSLVFSLGPLPAVAVFSVLYLFSGPVYPFFARAAARFTSKNEQPATGEGRD